MTGLCRWVICVALSFAVAHVGTVPAKAQSTEAYRLSSEESAQLRSLEKQQVSDLWMDRKVWSFLRRVFANVAGKTLVDPKQVYNSTEYMFLRLFHEQFSIPDGRLAPSAVEIEEGRFLFAAACQHQNCFNKAAFMADLTTGHVVMATFEPDYGVGIVRKACANPELKEIADARIRSWAKRASDGLRKYVSEVDAHSWRSVETPCRPETVEPSYDPTKKTVIHSKRSRDRLAPSELAALREMVGKPSASFSSTESVKPAIDRVFYSVAGQAGFYGGNTRNSKPPVAQDFRSHVFSEIPSRLVDDRFLVIGGCAFSKGPDACWQSGSMAIDLTTGYVAVAIVHRFDARGTTFYERGHLSILMRACADPALLKFAKAHFPVWAKAELRHVYRDDIRSVGTPSILTSRCA